MRISTSKSNAMDQEGSSTPGGGVQVFQGLIQEWGLTRKKKTDTGNTSTRWYVDDLLDQLSHSSFVYSALKD